jgi:hypothetical protein
MVDGWRVVYSVSNCTIAGYDEKNKQDWSIDLKEKQQCNIRSFLTIDAKWPMKLRKYDALIQFTDGTHVGLKVRSGRMITLPQDILQEKRK